MGKLRQMYMDTFVDRKKVEESAYKVANDRRDPSPVLVHYHKHRDKCSQPRGMWVADDKHKMVLPPEEEKDG